MLSLSVNIGYRLSRTWVVDRAPRRSCLVRWWDWGTHDSEGITSGSCVSTTSDSPPHHLLSVSPPLLHLTTSAQRWRDHRCAWFKLNAVVLQRWNGRPGNVSVVSVDIHDKKVKFRGWYYRNPSRWPRKQSNFCFEILLWNSLFASLSLFPPTFSNFSVSFQFFFNQDGGRLL